MRRCGEGAGGGGANWSVPKFWPMGAVYLVQVSRRATPPRSAATVHATPSQIPEELRVGNG